MGWIWIIVAVIIFAVAMYALGRWPTADEKLGFIPVIGVLSAAWPLLLAIVIVVGPFAGLFYLGEYVREKKEGKTNR